MSEQSLGSLAVVAGASWLMGWLLLGLAFALGVGAYFLVNAVTDNESWAFSAFFAVFVVYYLRGIVSSISQGRPKDPGEVIAILKNGAYGGIAAVLAVVLFVSDL